MTLFEGIAAAIDRASAGWTIELGYSLDIVEFLAQTPSTGPTILLSYDGDEVAVRRETGRAMWRQVWNVYLRARTTREQAPEIMREYRKIRAALDGLSLTDEDGNGWTCIVTGGRPDYASNVASPVMALLIE